MSRRACALRRHLISHGRAPIVSRGTRRVRVRAARLKRGWARPPGKLLSAGIVNSKALHCRHATKTMAARPSAWTTLWAPEGGAPHTKALSCGANAPISAARPAPEGALVKLDGQQSITRPPRSPAPIVVSLGHGAFIFKRDYSHGQPCRAGPGREAAQVLCFSRRQPKWPSGALCGRRSLACAAR